MAACFALGASAVQVGSRFVACHESSAHSNFKQAILNSHEGDTVLTLKEITPVRLIKNKFYNQLDEAYKACASKEELQNILGRGRAKKGMFEGDLDEGELEIGQVSASIKTLQSAAEIVAEMVQEFNTTSNKMATYCY
jgi:enoyl-[acyl-carrier protein] reductase II